MARRVTRKRDAEATRSELLTTATRVFAELGFAGARIDEIALAAGVNKRMIYVYFGDKEGLYREVLASYFGQVAAALSLPAQTGMSPRAQAEAIIRSYFELLAAHPELVRLLLWEMLSEEGRARAVILEVSRASLDSLHDVIRRGVADGSFKRGLDERRAVMSVNALCLGYFIQERLLEALWSQRLRGAAARQGILTHTLELVFDGLCTGETR
jgi:TetR/AcrR family transcriptional regulator